MEHKIARLLLYQNNTLLRKIALLEGQQGIVSIGRQGSGAILDLNSNFVSQHHADITLDGSEALWLTDHSRNGTFVNGKRIENSYHLKHGDTIIFGSDADGYRLVIEILNPADITTAQRQPTTLVQRPQTDDDNDKMPLAEPPFNAPISAEDSAPNFNFLNDDHSLPHILPEHPQPLPDNAYFDHATNNLSELLRHKTEITIGRSNDCDIVLPQLTVTRHHAVITRDANNNYWLRDLGSRNGTFVNGQRIKDSVQITEGDDILIGAFKFRLQRPVEDLRQQKNIALIADGLTRTVNGGKIAILNDVSFKANNNDFIAIMGPSGCGKSTLLRALNGEAPATSGKVYIYGMELYKNYDYLKRFIGYVPQDDIVHRELTVQQSLYYAAKLRLSSDVSNDDIARKINEVLTNLNIVDPETQQRKIGELSGGQRKRVSIAVELLTDPTILFLDEPTSPLDPETIEDFLVCVRQLAQKGTTILMVTHKPDDLYYTDKILFLAKGGLLTYYGDKNKALAFFEAKNVIEIYSKNRTFEQGLLWAKKLRGIYPPSGIVHLPNEDFEKRDREPFFRQLYWLTRRYFSIKTGDRSNVLALLLQAPIIALLVGLIFDEIELSVLFLMTISAIWFGTNNAAREIVGELPIYKRERMFNLNILTYVLSKIIVLGFFSLIQTFSFITIVWYTVGTDALRFQHYGQYSGLLFLLSFSATLLGLFISARVDNVEKVMTWVPVALIPQIMLAGVITTISEKSPVEFISYGMFSRWGTQGFAYIQDSIRTLSPFPEQPDSLVYRTSKAVDFLNLPNTLDLAPQLSVNIWALLLLDLLLLIGIVWTLKGKDSL